MKMLFFAQKYLTRYTPDMFLEEYINFKIGTIPVQSLGSHIRPQPPGLGVKKKLNNHYLNILKF
jgi:hypothetical protein